MLNSNKGDKQEPSVSGTIMQTAGPGNVQESINRALLTHRIVTSSAAKHSDDRNIVTNTKAIAENYQQQRSQRRMLAIGYLLFVCHSRRS